MIGHMSPTWHVNAYI